MKRLFFLVLIMFLVIISYGQTALTEITIGLNGTETVNALNGNFERLRDSLDLKLTKTDTTSMLAPYARTSVLAGYESALGNPTVDGYVLSSTAAGVRSWIAQTGGSSTITDLDGTNWRVFYSNGTGDLTELALGASGTYLQSAGASSAPTWSTPSGSGDVSKVGTPVNDQVGIWTGDGTLEGDSDLTFDGTSLTGTFIGNLTGTASLVTGFSRGSGSLALVGDDAVTLTTYGTTSFRALTSTSDTLAYRSYVRTYIDGLIASGETGVAVADSTGYAEGNYVTHTQLDTKEDLLANSTGLASALSDETGTGVAVFGTSPTFTTQITIGSGTITATEAGYIDPTSSIQDQLDDKADAEITENAQTGTAYTLVLADAGKRITCTNAAAITVTVPPNSSVAFPVGTQIIIEQWGAGTVSIAEGSGVTVNSLDSATDLQGQYATAVLIKDASDVWILSGAIE